MIRGDKGNGIKALHGILASTMGYWKAGRTES